MLIADDHSLVRGGIRALLEKLPGVEVVAEAGDGREALRLVEENGPHLVLMDIGMPELNGLEATRRIAKEFRHVKVLILSVHADEEHVHQALRAGAAGYLLKGSDRTELEVAIKAVMRGDMYLSPPISKQIIEDYVRRVGGRGSLLDSLTPRQREVLQMTAEGATTREIAKTLNVSVKTVESHQKNLKERLGIYDKAGLTRYAIRAGLIGADDV